MPGVREGVVAHRDEVRPVREVCGGEDGRRNLHHSVEVALGAELDARVAVGVRGDVKERLAGKRVQSSPSLEARA